MASTSTSTSTSPAALATPSSSPSMQSLDAQVLNSTNYYRRNFLASPLTWNDTLASYATKWAKGCIWKHSGGPYGENLAEGFPSTTLAVDAWANEEAIYNYAKQKFSETTGHFTQLVWQETTSVGCGLIQCDNSGAQGGIKGAYLVCEYSPRGNIVGEYVGNVKKPGMGAHGELGFGSGAAGAGRKGGVKSSMAALVVAWLFVVGVY
ncbi:DNA mismatch repair msh3 [Lecanosticta acicola]|uniref:DNA mismatch repair msh3 n=1 Tax=Lecanosticta acicola TaxID=111012 RepID=A0AAI8Z004_9PEZI|nr:DNA mismatch repair msh3 [Lecanosticta acicola]